MITPQIGDSSNGLNYKIIKKYLKMFDMNIFFQFDRGVYSLMGSVDPESFDTLHSFSNAFEMPFVTPWYPEKVPGMDKFL